MSNKFVKITSKSFENHTGVIGGAFFENGFSVEKMHPIAIDRLAANIQIAVIEETENGEKTLKPVGPGFRDQERHNYKLEVPNRVTQKMSKEDFNALRFESVRKNISEGKEVYTEEMLDGIVKTKGLNALKEIGASFKIFTKDISKLKSKILEVQEAKLARIEKEKIKILGEQVEEKDEENFDSVLDKVVEEVMSEEIAKQEAQDKPRPARRGRPKKKEV